ALVDPCWPSEVQWDTLNTTLSGRLIRAVPPGAACYPTRPEYDEMACQAIIDGWGHSSWHSSNPVSIPAPAMANDSCNPIYPNGTSITGDVDAGKKGCSIGSYPVYVVNATDHTHIQATVQFAKKWNLRLTIKNTGHNGAGRIWTHNLKEIEYKEKFELSGNCTQSTNATQQMAITIGAGVQDGELFSAAAKSNVVAVGGTSNDVGVVGWATGGGHGTLTGADNIIEATMVTADGDHIIVNQCQHSDLFWAIRGGGGGTFGVIASLTIKAYPMPSVNLMGLNILAKNGTTSTQWWKLIADIHGLMPAAQDEGLSGYWTLASGPAWGMGFSMLQYDKHEADAAEVQQPFIDLIHASNASITYNITKSISPSWYQLLSSMPTPESAGTTKGITASRFITRRTVLENRDSFLQTLEAIAPKHPAPMNGEPNFSMSGTMTASKTPM
ncbi:putative FAD-linked oxidoreductase-like protein 14, partial [Colletotrichum chlorophyti]